MKKIINFINPEAFRRYDRSMLIKHPELWATRIHYVIFYGSIFNFLTIILSFLWPITFFRIPDIDNPMIFLGCFSGLIILLWTYSQTLYDPRIQYGINLKGYEFKKIIISIVGCFVIILPLFFCMLIMGIRVSSSFDKKVTPQELNEMGFKLYSYNSLFSENTYVDGHLTDSIFTKQDSIKKFNEVLLAHKKFGTPQKKIDIGMIQQWYKERNINTAYNDFIRDLQRNASVITEANEYTSNWLAKLFVITCISMLIAYFMSIYTIIIKFFDILYRALAPIVHFGFVCCLIFITTIMRGIIQLPFKVYISSDDVVTILSILLLLPAFIIYRKLSKASTLKSKHILLLYLLNIIIFMAMVSMIDILRNTHLITSYGAQESIGNEIADIIFFVLWEAIFFFLVTPSINNLAYRLYSLPKET